MDFELECKYPNCDFMATKTDLEAHELDCLNRFVRCKWCGTRVGFEIHEDHELCCGLRSSLGHGTNLGPQHGVQHQPRQDVQLHHGHNHHHHGNHNHGHRSIPQDYDQFMRQGSNHPDHMNVYHNEDHHEDESEEEDDEDEIYINIPYENYEFDFSDGVEDEVRQDVIAARQEDSDSDLEEDRDRRLVEEVVQRGFRSRSLYNFRES